MTFTDREAAYLRSQRLARLATVSPDGQPDVVPVGFELDGDRFYVAGMPLEGTRKHRNVLAGHDKVALVVDDVTSVDPWAPRLVRVYGTARVVERDGRVGSGKYLEITPTVSWSFNLGGDPIPHPPDQGSAEAASPEQFRPHKTRHRASHDRATGPTA